MRSARRLSFFLNLGLGLACLAVVLAPAGVLAQTESAWSGLEGRTLSEALESLQTRGLPLVFTSEVVTPAMWVLREPQSEEPRSMLDELLEPWGLEVREASDGTLVVVPGEAGALQAGRLTGTVRAALSGRGVPGAIVRIGAEGVEVRAGADGRFELGVPNGEYQLTASSEGFLPGVSQTVLVQPAEINEVVLILQEIPLLQEELVIRPSRVQLTWEEPTSSVAIGRREIEALPHLGNDIFRAMSLVPGVSANDITARFWVHGGRPDEVKIELDGQELYEAFHLKDYDDALSVVAADSLAGLSLSTGSYPVSEGDRMSGVLDMRTRAPEGGLHASFSASLLNFAASGSGLLQQGQGDWLAQARLGSIDLASRLFSQEDPSYSDLFARLSVRPSRRQSLRGHALLSGDALRFGETTNEGFKLRNTEYENAYLWLTHQFTAGASTLVDTRVGWSAIERDRKGSEREEEGGFVVSDRRSSRVSEIEQSWSLFALSKVTLELGAEGRFYDSDYDYLNDAERTGGLPVEISPDWPATPTGSFTRFEGPFESDHLGAWVSGRAALLDSLSAEIGLRYDRHTLTDDTLVSPRANLAWKLGQESLLRASWGHFHQSQRPYELGVQDGEDQFSSAERSVHWLLGYEWLRAGLIEGRSRVAGLRAELFHRDISDPRERFENLFEAFNLYPEVEPDRVSLAPEKSFASGIELSFHGRLGGRAQWRFNYSWAVVEDRILSGTNAEWYKRQTDQPHTASVIVGFPIGRHWRLDFAGRFHTGRPTTPARLGFREDEEGEPQAVLILGLYNGTRLGAYRRLDLRASRHWRLGRGQLSFFADVQNLFNRRNAAGFDYSYDEELGRLVVEPEEWPGFFPSLGVKWAF